MSEGYSGILQIYPHQDSWTWIHTIVLPPYHWKAHQNVSDEKKPHSFLRIPWRRGVPSSSNPTNVRSLPSSRLTIALPQEQVFHQYISPTNLQTSHMKELNRTKSLSPTNPIFGKFGFTANRWRWKSPSLSSTRFSWRLCGK